jgi:hypothetical protein
LISSGRLLLGEECQEAAVKVITANFKTIFPTQEWEEFAKSYPDLSVFANYLDEDWTNKFIISQNIYDWSTFFVKRFI